MKSQAAKKAEYVARLRARGHLCLRWAKVFEVTEEDLTPEQQRALAEIWAIEQQLDSVLERTLPLFEKRSGGR